MSDPASTIPDGNSISVPETDGGGRFSDAPRDSKCSPRIENSIKTVYHDRSKKTREILREDGEEGNAGS